MRFRRLALSLALVAACSPISVSALTIISARPHNVNKACSAVRDLIKAINSNKELGLFTLIYTDEHGLVDRNERTSFHDYMRFSEGKADETPIAVEDVFLLEKDEFSPLYVAELSRWRWHNGHEDENGLAGEAGYEAVRNYWLVEFSSDDIRVLREARWLYQIIDRDKKLRDCRNG